MSYIFYILLIASIEANEAPTPVEETGTILRND